MRKLLGVLLAVLALGGGGFGSRQVEASRNRAVLAQSERAGEAAARRAALSLAQIEADLKLKVGNAAANPRLGFALHGNVDEGTMRDLWRTEEWWRPWRTEFKVYAVSFSDRRLDVVEGIDGADLDAEALVREVHARGEPAAEIIVGKAWPYAAAATTVKVPGRDRAPILLLAKPVDAAMASKLAEGAGGAVTLSDGKRSLLDAGPVTERAALARAIGSETASPLFHPPDATWVGAARPLSSGLWLWTYASTAVALHDAGVIASERKTIVWLIAGLVAGAALVIGLVGGRARLAPAATAGLGQTGAPELSPGMHEVGLPRDSALSPPRTSFPGQTAVMPGTLAGTATTTIGGAAASQALASAIPVARDATFGRYTLLDRLGEGGMAEVYTAVTFGAQGFRRKFVIKRLRPELSRDPSAVDQFIDEANLASSMVHSNIVPVFDFGKVGEEYFLAEEYILGRDLARVTRRSMETETHALPAQVMLYIARETLRALEYAHTKASETGQALEIVHRDVSPTNVIISARGEVKLCDFGIVKAEGRITKTQSGVVKGNVTFMSPEQARGTAIDARADLFSLALVIYYCLTGQVLYMGDTTYELLVKAATGPGPAEFDLIRALPAPFPALLERALRVQPGERYQSAREFGDAVAAHVGDGATELAALMNHLFAADFRDEEQRFRLAGPTSPSGPIPGYAETEPRR